MAATKDALIVTISGGAGQIAYSLAPLIARGAMLGPDQKVVIRVFDVEAAMRVAEGVVMELKDCALPLLKNAEAVSDPQLAFKDADVIILCGAMPRKQGMERKDLLAINAKIFAAQGGVIGAVASPECRVLVVGNPANTNALILTQASGGKLDPRRVSALTRLDMNRARNQIAARLGVNVKDVHNATIWGNHSNTQVPDAYSATVGGKPLPTFADMTLFGEEFVKCVQQRGADVIAARGLSSACSAAAAIVDHVRDWILGTPVGESVSMAVWSTGNPFGVPENIFFSFPVTCAGGAWSFAAATIAEPLRPLIEKTTKELLEEREMALP